MIQPNIYSLDTQSYVYYTDIVDSVLGECRGSVSDDVDYDEVSDSVGAVIDWYQQNGDQYTDPKTARREVIREMGGFWALIFPWLLSAVARFVIDQVIPWLYSNEQSADAYRKQIKGQ